MPRDNGGDMQYSYGCYGGTHWLPFTDLVVQGEVRLAAHRLCSLGCWSYLHPNRGHSSTLMRLQKSDPIFNMRIDVMRPAYNFEAKYRVTMFTRDEWTWRPGTPPAVKGLVWYTDGSKTRGEPGPESTYGQSSGRTLSISLGKYATVFQAEIYAIWAWEYEIRTDGRPQEYVSSCSDSQVALKALQAAKTPSPLAQQC